MLTKLQTIEAAKLKRREAMAKILDSINDVSDSKWKWEREKFW